MNEMKWINPKSNLSFNNEYKLELDKLKIIIDLVVFTETGAQQKVGLGYDLVWTTHKICVLHYCNGSVSSS